MNRVTIPLFNAAYQFKILRQNGAVLPLPEILFPLAGMGFYFRLYGNGLLEHQVLVPHDRWSAYWPKVAGLLSAYGVHPVVSSLKLFAGPRKGISFAGDGVSLTINLVNDRRGREFLEALDLLDCDTGGVANPIKDSRLGRQAFSHQAPMLTQFMEQRAALDPIGQFRSCLSERLGL